MRGKLCVAHIVFTTSACQRFTMKIHHTPAKWGRCREKQQFSDLKKQGTIFFFRYRLRKTLKSVLQESVVFTQSTSKFPSMSADITARTSQRAQHLGMSESHQKLFTVDAASTCRFFNFIENYVHKIQARASQLGDKGVSTESSRPIELKVSIDIDHLQSTTALRITQSPTSYDDLTDLNLLKFFHSEAS